MGRSKAKTPPKPPVPQRTEAEERADLENEFGSLMDVSIIFLLHQDQGYEKARESLLELSKTVREEEASGFEDVPYRGPDMEADLDGDAAQSGTTTSSSWAAASDSDSGTPVSSAASEQPPPAACPLLAHDVCDIDALLVANFRSLFTAVKDPDIRRAVKEAKGDENRVFDILSNLQHLEETGQRPKGIDGFFVPEHFPVRKGKKKNVLKENAHGRQLLPVNYKLAPPQLDEAAAEAELHVKLRPTIAASTPPPGTALYVEREMAAKQSWATVHASYATATAAYRRGRSDPHFRQVAAVYAERGREQAAVAKQVQSEAADALVDHQSYEGTVDVHYVHVQDGVRIALERTRRWWQSLGEDRVRKARDSPLRVVTGSGVHSSSGYSRMYGEVGKALGSEGWKVQPGVGHYVVSGKKI